jgi:uncharacterized protein (TIGR03790 family)
MLVVWSVMTARAAGPGDSVVVVYNRNLPESKLLAEHYAARRAVPRGQLFGVDVNAASEVISRADFRDKMEKPIFDWLVKEKLFTRNPKKRTTREPSFHPVAQSRIRYLVLCYGIPLKIARDATIKETAADKLPAQLRDRNEAAVDADLALLPSGPEQLPLNGPIGNPLYLGTNHLALDPTNGLLMVARLDGPTVEIARGLVDKAMEAESSGLWGRAYIDSRGLTNGDHKLGDEWMRASAVITRRMGFETEHDERAATFSPGFPLSHVAIYAGWYDVHAAGPFTRPTVEFMPGAFAYHLHSYSANTLRSTNQHWVGPLLAKGATITMGSVDEPYLAGTPNIAGFLDRLIYRRWTFGEAAYSAQNSISWQTTVVGDPLYRPFGNAPDVLHAKLERENNPLVEWSHLRVVNLNLATGYPARDLIKYIEDIPAVATNSAVLQEKLGQLLFINNQQSLALKAFSRALKLKPSTQQKIRLFNVNAELQALLRHEAEAIEAYQQLLAFAPDYPETGRVHREMAALARKLGKTEDAQRFEKEAERLGAPPK